IEKEYKMVEEMKKQEDTLIADSLNYDQIKSLSSEGQQKMDSIRPETLGRASRISGVSASAISVLSVYLNKYAGHCAQQHHITTKDVPRETIDSAHKVYQEYNDQLKLYCDRLLWWNSRVNLVSRNVSRETLHKHILHSLLLGGFSTFQDAGLVVDAGSGNGLPGIPLSLTNKNQCFVLNDVVTKKCLAMK